MARQSDLAANCEDTQGRHQSFHPRHSWFKRAFDEIAVDDGHQWRLFYAEDATTRLGVGKNMVASIRFWASAARYLTEIPDPDNGRRRVALPTLTGEAVLDPGGYDPYMERPGTWWLTHWLLLSPPHAREPDSDKCQTPSWWALLHLFSGTSFTVDEATEWLCNTLEDEFGSAPSETSVKRDVQTFVHAYSREVDSRAKVDDLIDSPLRQLGLVESAYGDSTRYRLVTGHKHSLPDLVAAYGVLDFLDRRCLDDSLVARPEFVEHVAAMDGSPTRTFRITEKDLKAALRGAADDLADVVTVRDDPAQGLTELRVADGQTYRSAADAALARYYGAPELPTGDTVAPSAAATLDDKAAA